MTGVVVAVCLCLAAWAMVAVALKHRERRIMVEQRRLPGQLTAAERRRLYQRLGIDPAALARQRRSNVIWLDVNRMLDRRTDA